MKPITKIIISTLAIISIFLIINYLYTHQFDFRKSASGTQASITIDTQHPGPNLSNSLWQNLSQGGEEPKDMLSPVIKQIKELHPQLIRIDHLFDFYKVDDGTGHYDFSRLDHAVDSILATGAKPMLSLSYTPDSKEPSDWNQWTNLISATIHHYSIDKKIDGIYYEVWNEPDLFGSWHYNKTPNYSTLYIKTAQAALQGAPHSNYKIGGPAITAYYSNWIKSLFQTASQNNLPLDFISWHKYSVNINDYLNDFDNLNQILSDYPQYFNIERLITEIGPDSNPNSSYDNKISGIHLISLCTQLSGKIHRIFTFEIIDGPSPRSAESSGWGILTYNQKPKPRYFAIQFLNKLQGQKLPSSGDGSWVSSLATKNSQNIQVLVVNYDPKNSHTETTPITFQNLNPGNYQLKSTSYLGETHLKKLSITQANYTENLYLEPNSAYIIELQPLF